jgi:hypothetical protein
MTSMWKAWTCCCKTWFTVSPIRSQDRYFWKYLRGESRSTIFAYPFLLHMGSYLISLEPHLGPGGKLIMEINVIYRLVVGCECFRSLCKLGLGSLCYCTVSCTVNRVNVRQISAQTMLLQASCNLISKWPWTISDVHLETVTYVKYIKIYTIISVTYATYKLLFITLSTLHVSASAGHHQMHQPNLLHCSHIVYLL